MRINDILKINAGVSVQNIQQQLFKGRSGLTIRENHIHP
jgi:predicted RNA-binding protein with RPS1 domain